MLPSVFCVGAEPSCAIQAGATPDLGPSNECPHKKKCSHLPPPSKRKAGKMSPFQKHSLGPNLRSSVWCIQQYVVDLKPSLRLWASLPQSECSVGSLYHVRRILISLSERWRCVCPSATGCPNARDRKQLYEGQRVNHGHALMPTMDVLCFRTMPPSAMGASDHRTHALPTTCTASSRAHRTQSRRMHACICMCPAYPAMVILLNRNQIHPMGGICSGLHRTVTECVLLQTHHTQGTGGPLPSDQWRRACTRPPTPTAHRPSGNMPRSAGIRGSWNTSPC